MTHAPILPYPECHADEWRLLLGDPELICLRNATFTRAGSGPALRDVTWSLREGETWAVVGATGSGKTTFAEVLLGRHPLAQGWAEWPLLDRLRARGRPVACPSEVIRH